MMQSIVSIYNGVLVLTKKFEEHTICTDERQNQFLLSLAIPIVIMGTLGIEIGLKMLIKWEGGNIDEYKTHKLNELYNALSSRTKKTLEGKIIDPPEWFNWEKFLDYHQDSFVEWRYRWEKKEDGMDLFSPGMILRILQAIMDTIYANQPRKVTQREAELIQKELDRLF